MSTNLKEALRIANDLQCYFIETVEKNEPLQQIIDAMASHESEHGWINQRLNMLVEIYNIVGADGSQCVDRIKEWRKIAEPHRDETDNGYISPNNVMDLKF